MFNDPRRRLQNIAAVHALRSLPATFGRKSRLGWIAGLERHLAPIAAALDVLHNNVMEVVAEVAQRYWPAGALPIRLAPAAHVPYRVRAKPSAPRPFDPALFADGPQPRVVEPEPVAALLKVRTPPPRLPGAARRAIEPKPRRLAPAYA